MESPFGVPTNIAAGDFAGFVHSCPSAGAFRALHPNIGVLLVPIQPPIRDGAALVPLRATSHTPVPNWLMGGATPMFKRRNTLLRSVFELALTFSKTEVTRLHSHSLFRGVLRYDAPLFGAWRRNRRRPCECRAGLMKYAAARPLFALRAGRMAASGIICRGSLPRQRCRSYASAEGAP